MTNLFKHSKSSLKIVIVTLIFLLKIASSDSQLMFLLYTRSLPRDGGMAGDHGAPEAGQPPGSGPEVVKRQRVAKESIAGQCRMR